MTRARLERKLRRLKRQGNRAALRPMGISFIRWFGLWMEAYEVGIRAGYWTLETVEYRENVTENSR